DSHDVDHYIVGQGRSYVACPDADPGRLDVARACQSLRAGRVLVSLGLLVQLSVNERFSVGDLAPGLGNKKLNVKVTVRHPSWIQADRIELFANGVKIRESRLEPGAKRLHASAPSARNLETVDWTLPRPTHDQYIVAIASGPGVTAPYWPLAPPFQPTS